MPIFESFGFDFVELGLRKKVSVSVSENLVSEKEPRFRKIWSQKKVSVSENLVKEKSRFRKNLVSEEVSAYENLVSVLVSINLDSEKNQNN